MIHLKKIILFSILITISACSSIPKNTQNSCAIFEERYLWYKHAKSSYEKWGAPIHLQLAFVKKESDFNWLAKPPRKNYSKSFLSKDLPVLSDILKLLKELGNNIKKKQIVH